MNEFEYLKIEMLYETAYEAYKCGEYKESVECFDKALKLAEKIGDENAIVRIKFWKSAALVVLGKLKQTLTECLEAVKIKNSTVDIRDVFNIYLNIIDVGMRIPTSFQSIENSFRQAEQYCKSVGEPHWWSLLLVHKSDFETLRGNYENALEFSLEAWARYERKYPSNIPGSYIDDIVDLNTKLGRYEVAQSYFVIWQELDNVQPVNRVVRISKRKIAIARATHQIDKALDIALRLNQTTSKLYDKHELIETYLAHGSVNNAKNLIVKFLHENHISESLYKQCYCFQLLGDFHYAYARKLAGLQPVDVEYPIEKDVFFEDEILLIKTKENTKFHIKRALQCYHSALQIATEIDVRLETQLYKTRENKRIDAVRHLSGKLV